MGYQHQNFYCSFVYVINVYHAVALTGGTLIVSVVLRIAQCGCGLPGPCWRSFSSPSSSSESSLLAAALNCWKSLSVSPSWCACHSFLHSSRAIFFKCFSWCACLSLLGMDALTSSAVNFFPCCCFFLPLFLWCILLLGPSCDLSRPPQPCQCLQTLGC